MKIVRNCPKCDTLNIQGTISIKEGRYIQKIYCQDCPYHNNRDIGSALEEVDTGGEIDEE